jgi:hypothetical protein
MVELCLEDLRYRMGNVLRTWRWYLTIKISQALDFISPDIAQVFSVKTGIYRAFGKRCWKLDCGERMDP